MSINDGTVCVFNIIATYENGHVRINVIYFINSEKFPCHHLFSIKCDRDASLQGPVKFL